MSDSPNHPEAVAVDLEEGERLLREATPGPWEYHAGELNPVVYKPHVANAALIVYAVNALPALLASVREAGELREAAKEVQARCEKWAPPGTLPFALATSLDKLFAALQEPK